MHVFMLIGAINLSFKKIRAVKLANTHENISQCTMEKQPRVACK
jgi:hypothetical protein